MSKRRMKKAMAKPVKPGVDPGFKPRELRARTPNQERYINAALQNQVTLVSGPAGTGKTHIAVGMAIKMLRARQIDKIILTRPLVGIGKDVGFFPGGLDEKVGPYLIPYFDELQYYLSYSMLVQLQREKVIEAVPPFLLRGRTFNNAYIIMDEAQNASCMELKTLLTRFGETSKMVIAGDFVQSDLPEYDQGAFKTVVDRLYDLDGIEHVPLTNKDIVRARIISEILDRLTKGF